MTAPPNPPPLYVWLLTLMILGLLALLLAAAFLLLDDPMLYLVRGEANDVASCVASSWSIDRTIALLGAFIRA